MFIKNIEIKKLKYINLLSCINNKDLIFSDKEYINLTKDLIFNDNVLKMKKYIQHGNTSCYDHCINVSYYSYLLCKKLKFDYTSAARAGLLHDFFLYDWHDKKEIKEKLFEKHGFTHPITAYNNAIKYFKLNKIEKDIIIKHMWPLTISLPKYKETFIIVLIDKLSCLFEFFNYHFPLNIKKINIY